MIEHWSGGTPSDAVAEQVQVIRKRRGWSAKRLAERCAEIGAPELTESVIANIESGRRDQSGRRRRDVSVDELWAFAQALEVPVGTLIWPFMESMATQDQAAMMRFSPRELHLFVHRIQTAAAELLDRLPPPYPESEAGRVEAAKQRKAYYKARKAGTDG